MRQIPPSIRPDDIFRSDELAEFWQLSRDSRRDWYRTLDEQFKTTAARAGNHFVVTGRDALASLAISAATASGSTAAKKSS